MESANNNKKCPICKKAADVKLQPFCSKRCADVDLGRWLKGSYVIPGESTNIEIESEEADY